MIFDKNYLSNSIQITHASHCQLSYSSLIKYDKCMNSCLERESLFRFIIPRERTQLYLSSHSMNFVNIELLSFLILEHVFCISQIIYEECSISVRNSIRQQRLKYLLLFTLIFFVFVRPLCKVSSESLVLPC